MDWGMLIGGLGLGTIISSVVREVIQHKRIRSDRVFEQKKEAYIGLLGAIRDAVIQPGTVSSAMYAYHKSKIELMGSPDVYYYANKIPDTDPNSPERDECFKKIMTLMRQDLKIDKRPLRQE